jgi:hypothetical protein
VDEEEIHKTVVSSFLLDWVMLQWRLAAGEDIPTPNTNKIVVFSSFFQRGFGLPACDFFRGLLDHYKIELVHLNPNSILQIVILVHLYEAFLYVTPNFPLFKTYFSLKYQLSAVNQKVIRVVGLQTLPRIGFLGLPLKSSLWRWHGTWFYCKNHEPSLPSFVGQLLLFQATWSEEPTPLEAPQVAVLADKVSLLKLKCLTGVFVAAH